MGLLPENEPQQEIADRKLGFDARVPSDGYRWWYLDAFSDDGKAALTIIVFIGSVFSPYYYSARRRNLGTLRSRSSQVGADRERGTRSQSRPGSYYYWAQSGGPVR